MKINKKILSFVLVLVLILSLSTPALAATITETYYYTVTKTSTFEEKTIVSEVLLNHVQGSSDSIPYSYSKRDYRFTNSVFPDKYRSQLGRAYTLEGLPQRFTIQAASGRAPVFPGAPTGTYSAYLFTTRANCAWSVSRDGNSSLGRGSFVSIPISYRVAVAPHN